MILSRWQNWQVKWWWWLFCWLWDLFVVDEVVVVVIVIWVDVRGVVLIQYSHFLLFKKGYALLVSVSPSTPPSPNTDDEEAILLLIAVVIAFGWVGFDVLDNDEAVWPTALLVEVLRVGDFPTDPIPFLLKNDTEEESFLGEIDVVEPVKETWCFEGVLVWWVIRLSDDSKGCIELVSANKTGFLYSGGYTNPDDFDS